MIRYPRFCAVVDDIDLGMLARRSGVPAEVIGAIIVGDHAAELGDQMRIGRALRLNPLELFALDDDLEVALADAEAQGHPRWVADVPALQVINSVLVMEEQAGVPDREGPTS